MRFAGLSARSFSRFLTTSTVAAIAAGASLLLGSPALEAQQAPQVLPYTMSTYAGPNAAYTAGTPCGSYVALDTQGDGCLARDVSVGADPHDVRVDPIGNVFWVDNASAGIIHRIDGETLLQTVYVGSSKNAKPCSGAVDTFGDGCLATDGAANNDPNNLTTSTKFKAQRGLATGINGDVYSAGYNDAEVHRVSAATGVLTIVAGTGTAASTANTGPATQTGIGSVRGVGVDSAGNVYIADTGAHVIQEVVNGQIVLITKANPNALKQVDSGVPASSAYVNAPEDVQIDIRGNIYIADFGNNVIRGIYSGNGPFFNIPNPQAGYIYTIAGSGLSPAPPTYSYGNLPVATSVPATSVGISTRKLSVDYAGNLYVADSSNNVLWFVDVYTGYMRDMAGEYGSGAAVCSTAIDTVGDGCPGFQATLLAASDMGAAADNQGNLYITDAEGGAANARIRKLLSGLNFPAIAANASITQSLDIHLAPGDGLASATVTSSDFTTGTPSCTINADATVDCLVPVTFKPTKAGYNTARLTATATLGGQATFLLTGTGTGAALAVDPGAISLTTSNVKSPQNVTVDANGNGYIADTGNNRVLMVTAGGVVSTIAGTGTASYSGDGGAATAATLKSPKAVAVDTAGNIFITDSGNNRIRKITAATGIISTYGGGASSVCSAASNSIGDFCPATQATFSSPAGLVADRLGNLFVADTGNNRVREISSSGYVTTLAGGAATICTANTDTQGDGCPGTAGIFSAPTGLAWDAIGNNILVADTGNNIIRKIYLGNSIVITASPTATAIINPLTLIAGNGQAGSSIDANSTATLSQLTAPTGVAVDAAENTYIADTGNSAVRLVSAANGTISTIAGILGTAGSGSAPATATDITLNAPSGVAVLPNGQLYITDSGNNRVLADNRSATSYNFGRVSPNVSSTAENFIELSIGTSAATFNSTLFTVSGDTADFTLTPVSGSTGCAASTSLAPGASCTVQGVFTPLSTGVYTANYTTNASNAVSTPIITLTGTGAILTPTTSTVSQTAPSGSAQYGGSLTLTVSIAPSTCNTAAPACTPTGTARIIVDGTSSSPITVDASGKASQSYSGLSVGPHTVSCAYSGDVYYAASSCTPTTINVAAASTTVSLTATNNNSPQFFKNNCTTTTSGTTCTVTTLTATVASTTSGIPTGTVSFYIQGHTTPIGTASLNAQGVAAFPVSFSTDTGGNLIADNTFAPGTYTLTCTYNPASGSSSNFATSNCTSITFTVVAQAPGLSLVTLGCSTQSTATTVTSPPNQGHACPAAQFSNGLPMVTAAQGSVADVALFITPTNTLTGTLTFACSGLPQYAACTFSPSSVTLTAASTYVNPIPVDVTIWTDTQPLAQNNIHSLGSKGTGLEYAMVLGGFASLFLTRRKRLAKLRHARLLAAIPLLMLLAGASLAASGCANGPGDYKPQLTPAGSYPVTITISGPNNLKATSNVVLTVTSPGIQAIE